MSLKTLCLGPLVIPAYGSVLGLTLNYAPLGGSSIFRAADGTGIKQSTWKKTRITIAGQGTIPPGIDSLDFDQAMVLKCSTDRGVGLPAGVTSIALPPTRRTDAGHEPFALAQVGSRLLPAALSIAGDLATLTPVDGAQGYLVRYYPQYTVWVARPDYDTDSRAATHGWRLVCEEV